MKKVIFLFTVFCCLCRLSAIAQSYTQSVDSLFIHLNKSVITTGILYDRALPFASVNLVNKYQPDTTNHGYFIEAYNEMYNSAYSHTGWIVLDTLVRRVSSVNTMIPVGLSFYNYNAIDTNAMQNNLIQMHSDSLYYDTPGRTVSPYNTLNTFVAAPLADSVDCSSGIAKFYFPPNLFINKSSLTMTSLKVDFNDGKGLIAISLNATYSISYNQPNGNRYLKFVITMSNGLTYTTYGQIKIYHAPNGSLISSTRTRTLAIQGCVPSNKYYLFSTGTFQGYDESSATSGQGEMNIYYATTSCDGILRKPIILMDGFDPGDAINNDKLYQNFNTAFTAPTGSALYLDYLRSQGYDIVIVNFVEYINSNNKLVDGGADYIERNAQVLIEAIDKVNNLKQGTEKNIIIGASMGALITRYALAYMEQHNHLHNTKLYVSFDGPHNGANVPIGDQQFLDYYKNDDANAYFYLNNYVNSAAAKQMLINHYNSGTTSTGGFPGFRDRFAAALNTVGFPKGDPGQPFRKIAIVDGSLGGTTSYSACQTGFIFAVRPVIISINFLFKVRIKGAPIAQALMAFTPDAGSTCMVLRAAEIFKKGRSVNFTTPSYTSSYDNAPGGTFNSQGQIQSSGNGAISWIIGGYQKVQTSITNVIQNHSFIPTKSALAFKGTNQNLSENVSTRNLICTGETPFDSYFGSFTTNYFHLTLANDAANWLTQEILGNPQPPSVVKSSTTYTIAGPSTFCTSGTYSIANIPAGATVTWTATPSSAVTLTPSGQTVTLTKVNTSDVTLTANLVINCAPAPVQPFNLHEGGPVTPQINVFLKNMGGGTYNIIFSTPAVSGVTYQWVVNGQVVGGNSASYTTPASNCSSGGPILSIYDVQVNESNACGTNSNCQVFRYSCSPTPNIIANGSCNGGGDFALMQSLNSNEVFSYYPNPVNQKLTLSTKWNGYAFLNNQASIPFSYQLFDVNGKAVRKGSSDGKDIVLSINDLPNAIYYLHTKVNGRLIEKQIVVQH